MIDKGKVEWINTLENSMVWALAESNIGNIVVGSRIQRTTVNIGDYVFETKGDVNSIFIRI